MNSAEYSTWNLPFLVERGPHFLVELGVFVFLVGLSHCYAETWMLVEDSGYHVRNHVAPLDFISHRYHVVLNHPEDRGQVELWILEEPHEQFETAITRPAAYAVK